MNMYANFIKRITDFLFSLLFLFLFSPVLLLCAIATKLEEPHGTVLFKQERNGRDGKVFYVYKLRTMKQHLSCGSIIPTPDTLTKSGTIIRKLSLDELPQLINILKGEMSFIGPRPLPCDYYPWFTKSERQRFNVRPGITGLAQINGRANLKWDERFKLDVEYKNKLSILLDIKIVLKTVYQILARENVIVNMDTELVNFDEHRRRQLAKCEITMED